jgi:hypothetical protein
MLKEILGLDGRNFTQVAAPLFAYLFHRINQRQFVQIVGDREVTKRVLAAVKSNGYVLKNCKLYAWAYHKYRQGGPRPMRADYGVHREDATFLRRLNLAHLKAKYESYGLGVFDRLVHDVLHTSAMKAHIGKLISRKMIFLIRSYNLDREDLEGLLREAAVRALYKQYPRFESLLHLTNAAKTSIHNTAMTTITYNTCPARQRLYVGKDGSHQAVHDTLDNVANTVEAPKSYMDHVKDHLEAIVKLGPKMRPEVQSFLLCAAGHYHREFSEFLRDDNARAVDHMDYGRYLDKARVFFGLSEQRMHNIFERLRHHLA